jgi:hypothetical protein
MFLDRFEVMMSLKAGSASVPFQMIFKRARAVLEKNRLMVVELGVLSF